MKPHHWIYIGIAAFIAFFLFGPKAEAKDVFSKMLANGAVIVLTDEPCDLTYQGKVLTGKRSYGTLDGQINKSCWHYKKGTIYIIWYESDNKTVSGVNKYDASTFNRVVEI